MNTVDSRGVLHGVRVVEMAGLGPMSFTGMLRADMGTWRGRTEVVLARQPRLVFGRMTDLQARTAFFEPAGELQPAPAREVLAAWGARPPWSPVGQWAETHPIYFTPPPDPDQEEPP